MISPATYSQLSDISYKDTGAPAGWSRLPILPKQQNNFGYDGAAFKNNVTGEIVIVSRGTEPLSFDGDWSSNFQMGINKLPDQYDVALQFLSDVKAANRGASITLTGHSLGGSLTQLLAAQTGLTAVAFDPYGAADLIPALNARYGLSLNPNGAYSNIANHRTLLDPVSVLPFSTQLGTMQTHAPTLSGFVVWAAAVAVRLPIGFVGAGFWSHSRLVSDSRCIRDYSNA